ncbi:MAG: dihydroorotate dehydrogenase electron transfer subunit [Deltaproteobacteria bacterium]|nr:dihydroorotate dehydrogenase electron transfer subunit [Deltaproteobacteria bacterium]
MSRKYDIICPIIENTRVASNTFLMRMAAPEIAKNIRPGQFVMVHTSVEPRANPLLRRPFSIHRTTLEGEMFILYRPVGSETGRMSKMGPGEKLKVLGPLGNGFDLGLAEREAYLVAGGVGLAPIWALAEALQGKAETRLFYGLRSADEVVDFISGASGPVQPDEVIITTEDGSAGTGGLVTEPLAKALESRPAPVFACGPRPMLAAIAALAREAGVKAQVSLEERMACGMGLCMSCSVETADSTSAEPAYIRVCKEGPVFNAEEVKWQI